MDCDKHPWLHILTLIFFCCCHGLQQNDVDNNLYYNISCDELYIILSLYVDDMLLTRNGTFKLIELKKS
jgi:hypothetical protein